MTSHNEVLILSFGPLVTSSLGPSSSSEQSRSAHLNFSIQRFLSHPPFFSARVPRFAPVDTGHRIPQ